MTKAQSSTRWGKWLYDSFEPVAHVIKVALQMLMGMGTVCALGWKILSFSGTFAPKYLLKAGPLEIVAVGLEFAAGIELAYMLFTDGPDEAIQPLILGLSAATLLAISGSLSGISLAAAPTFVCTIGLLLWLKRSFIEAREASTHGVTDQNCQMS